jgi:hypothetical protein
MNGLWLVGLAAPFLLPPTTQAAIGQDQVVCIFGDAPRPTPCTLNDVVDQGGHRMSFVSGRLRATFVGRGNSGWWSGQLNGKPAMGYEVNRGHTVYSSLDLQERFEWWSRGAGPVDR